MNRVICDVCEKIVDDTAVAFGKFVMVAKALKLGAAEPSIDRKEFDLCGDCANKTLSFFKKNEKVLGK